MLNKLKRQIGKQNYKSENKTTNGKKIKEKRYFTASTLAKAILL